MRHLITICAALVFFGANYVMAAGTLKTLDMPESMGAKPDSTRITAIDGSNTIGQYRKTTDSFEHAFFYNVDGTAWTSLDQSGSIGSRLEGISGNKVVGINLITTNTSNVFLYNGDNQNCTTFEVPTYLGKRAGVNGIFGNNVVGSYNDTSSVHHGFLYDGTKVPSDPTAWTTLEPTGVNWTSSYPVGVSSNGVVGTYYIGDSKHGFLYDGTKVPSDPTAWTTFDMPGFPNIYPVAVSGNDIVGNYQTHDGLNHGFLYDGISWTTLDMPGATRTDVCDISGNNIVGEYTANDLFHSRYGFIYDLTQSATDPNSWTTLDFDPSSAHATMVSGIDGNSMVGYFGDPHGFMYTIPEPGTLAMLTSAGFFLLFAAWRRRFRK